jgi:hypothetical protein
MSVKYIILCEGRVGSSHLRTSLQSVPGLIVKGELSTNSGFNLGRFFKLTSLSITQNPSSNLEVLVKSQLKKFFRFRYIRIFTQLAYLHRIFQSKIEPETRAIGFHIKFRDIASLTVFRRFIDRYQIRIIYLTRENRVKHAMSSINAGRLYKKFGCWNSSKETEQLPPFVLTIKDFDAQIKLSASREAALLNFIKSLNTPILRLPYELLLKDRHLYFEQVFKFLDIPPINVKSTLAKTTPDNLRNVILNYDEVRAHFKNTDFYEMFS